MLAPSPPTTAELFIELHGAVEIQELWDSTCRLVHGLVDADFVCLCLRPFQFLPGTIFRDRHPFRTTEELQKFNQLSVFQPYVLAHPEERVIRIQDVLPDEELVKTPFYQECMAPCGYHHVMAMTFWNNNVLEGVICAHRAREAGPFSRAELGVFEEAHASFAVALKRVVRLHREHSVRLSLERFMQRVPLPTVLIDWDLQPIYANRAACEAAQVWALGREAARLLKRPQDIELPNDLLDLCREAQATWRPLPQNPNPGVGASFQRKHPSDPTLVAIVTLLQFGAEPGQRPTLLLQWEGATIPEGTSGSVAGTHIGKLSRLSPCERELALLVCEGLGTADLAARLGKSPLTVKKQLQSIYRKLEVPGRARLMAILR